MKYNFYYDIKTINGFVEEKVATNCTSDDLKELILSAFRDGYIYRIEEVGEER